MNKLTFYTQHICWGRVNLYSGVYYCNSEDPCGFDKDPDRDPRIRTTGLRIRIRILLFSSLTFNGTVSRDIFGF